MENPELFLYFREFDTASPVNSKSVIRKILFPRPVLIGRCSFKRFDVNCSCSYKWKPVAPGTCPAQNISEIQIDFSHFVVSLENSSEIRNTFKMKVNGLVPDHPVFFFIQNPS